MLSKKVIKYIPACLFLSAVLLNVIAWNSAVFCDLYVTHFFPIIGETYGRLTGLFPFSLGEWMLLAAFFMVVLLFGGGIMCLAGRRLLAWYRWYLKLCGWVASAACLVMTLNCLILYHCSPITEQYSIGVGEKRSYSVEELTILRDYAVTEANRLAEELPRDEKGYVIYQDIASGNIAANKKDIFKDMALQARKEMERLGEKYPRLTGYYPRPKPFFNSDFFSQQYIMGYFFPFSMEANYNSTMYAVNTPVTMCHELSHLKGFIYEDEASFIGFLACVDSEDPFFRYSAWLSVIGYLNRDFYVALDTGIINDHPMISELVLRDDVFLTPEAWEAVEEEALLDTQLVKEVSGEIIETNLTLNGVSDGRASYGRVVELLLQYYSEDI